MRNDLPISISPVSPSNGVSGRAVRRNHPTQLNLTGALIAFRTYSFTCRLIRFVAPAPLSHVRVSGMRNLFLTLSQLSLCLTFHCSRKKRAESRSTMFACTLVKTLGTIAAAIPPLKSRQETPEQYAIYTHLLFGGTKRNNTQPNRENRYGNYQRVHWSVSQPNIEFAGQGQARRAAAC